MEDWPKYQICPLVKYRHHPMNGDYTVSEYWHFLRVANMWAYWYFRSSPTTTMDVFQQNSATVNIRSYELKAIQQDQLFVKHCIL